MSDDKSKKITPEIKTLGTWNVNEYDAAVCISNKEINREFKKVFDSNDGSLPRSLKKTPTSFDWSIDVELGNPPRIDFDSTQGTNGVRLHLDVTADNPLQALYKGKMYPITDEKGNQIKGFFRQKTVPVNPGEKPSYNPITHKTTMPTKSINQPIPLTGTSFTIDTPMGGVEHCAKGVKGCSTNDAAQTEDGAFTVQSLYADLEYLRTPAGKNKLLTTITTTDDHSWPNDDHTAQSSVASVLQTLISESTSKVIIGATKIPKVAPTVGPFTPRGIRFTTTTDKVAQSEKDNQAVNGVLNWNIMCGDTSETVTMPDLATHETAGLFSKSPVPAKVPGVVLLSWGRLIKKFLVETEAFKVYGITKDDFDFPQSSTDPVMAKLNKEIAIADTLNGTFKAGEGIVIQPDPANNQIRIDFTLDNVTAKKGEDETLAKIFLPGEKFRLTWSWYLKFQMDDKQELVPVLTFDAKPHVKKMNDAKIWAVILWSLLGAATIETTIIAVVTENLKSAIEQVTQIPPGFSNIKTILKSTALYTAQKGDPAPVQLPGESIFDFDTVDGIAEGLRIHLKYK